MKRNKMLHHPKNIAGFLLLTLLLPALPAFNANSTPTINSFTASAQSCGYVCFRNAFSWQLRIKRLPKGQIDIAGVYNCNTSTTNLAAMKFALAGGPTSLQKLNREFAAAQLSVLDSVFSGVLGRLTQLQCYGVNIPATALNNGVVLTSASTIAEVFAQALSAASRNNTSDMETITAILRLLNDSCG